MKALQVNVQITQIAPAIMRCLNLPVPTNAPTTLSQRLGSAPKVCLAVIDGMGYQQLVERRAYLKFLRSRLESDPIYTCVPSTTAAALTALTTGQLPGVTNMLGYEVVDPATRARFNLINFKNSPVTPQQFQPVPTIFEWLNQLGVGQVATGAAKFVGSGLTLAALRGSNFQIGATLSERIETVTRVLREGASLAYFYYEGVDHAGHNYGWKSTQWLEELEKVDFALDNLARRLPKGTKLLITADHGMVDVTRRIDVSASHEIDQYVSDYAGEARALHVHFHPHQVEEGSAAWRNYFSDQAQIFDRKEMEQLVGPISNPSLLGDLTVFAGDTTALVDRRSHSAHACDMPGVHGGLSSAEREIPFIVEEI